VAISYLTITYPRWRAGREKHRQESDRNYAAARTALSNTVVRELPPQIARVATVETRTSLSSANDELRKRLDSLPTQRDWLQAEVLPTLQKDVDAFHERLNVATTTAGPVAEESRGELTHCAACGVAVPRSPFCQQCGARQIVTITCGQCGQKAIIPSHLFADGNVPAKAIFCTNCGATTTP
jgi:hypothetical protein